ncbi:MAG: pentapeptide repeat-containing protein [Acidobacteriaceae bacterium]|nr:pentapeptide repeat-containing protein [Acidobacteriaceae bacterium]MBV9781485.1 pentapeptide repeat-containing protein [Acidobacteriaceae bacterium]
MPARVQRSKPKNWAEYRSLVRSDWTLPFLAFEWGWEWVAWALSNWAFIEVLDRLGSFSVLVAVIFYFVGANARIRQAHYQAWQVINTAQGKGGSGGRIEALEQLNRDHVSLIGVDVSGAFLQHVQLNGARLSRCNLNSADLRESSFQNADLEDSDLRSTNFRNGNLEGAILRRSDLDASDFSEANLSKADLTGTDLSDADFRYTDLRDVRCDWLKRAKLADIYGARNAAPELIKSLTAAGAVSIQSDEEWNALEHKVNGKQSR